MPDDREGRAVISVEQEILDVAQALVARILERRIEDLRGEQDTLLRRGRAPLGGRAVSLGRGGLVAEELSCSRQPLRIRELPVMLVLEPRRLVESIPRH